MNDSINRERLLMMAAHLDTVDEESFDFRYVGRIVDGTENYKENQELPPSCQTNGCALFEMSRLWPETFMAYYLYFDKVGVRYRETKGKLKYLTSVLAANEWFGLTEDMGDCLFVPFNHRQPNVISEFGQLEEDATAKDVASHIRAFCNLSEEELTNYFNLNQETV